MFMFNELISDLNLVETLSMVEVSPGATCKKTLY
jgi:hypothetical protein